MRFNQIELREIPYSHGEEHEEGYLVEICAVRSGKY
jgi:hypothetical protein